MESNKTLSVQSVSESEEDANSVAKYSQKLSTILNELKLENAIMDRPPIRKAVESLESELQRAKALVSSPKYGSPPARKSEEDMTENLGRSLGLVLFASHDVSMNGKEKLEALRRELMNVSRFSTTASSDGNSEFVDDVETEDEEDTEEEEEEIVVDEDGSDDHGGVTSAEDFVLRLRCGGDDEESVSAVSGLRELIRDGGLSDEWIEDQGLIPVLFNRLGSTKLPAIRLGAIQVLRCLVALDGGNKDKMTEVGYLSTLVKSLTRGEEEQREAVGLLSCLCDVSAVKRRLGRIQGCIVMLVALFNGQDQMASHDAGKLLTALSGNTQNALHMAEAGYFKPLVNYLEGSDMSRILMATALSRMELRDQTRASIGEDGAIQSLVKMFKEGKLEAKLSSLSALQNLSHLKENTQRLISAGIVPSLLQLLFSVTSVLTTLREPASAILARIAQSDSILVNHEIALQMLSLLSLSTPVIQIHLLQTLNSIAAHSSASGVRRKMKENGSIQLLLPFLSEANAKIRTGALNLICTLSKELQEEMTEQIGEMYFNIIVDIISSATSNSEKATAIDILSNVLVGDKKAIDVLKKGNLLPVLVSIMGSSQSSLSPCLVESIAGMLIRFTDPSDKKLQFYSAEIGVIPILLKLLSSGSIIAKSRAATALAQLSQNSLRLRKLRMKNWFCVPPSSEAFCEVHDGFCFVKTNFCLVKAAAFSPLINILEGNEREADEAVLGAIATLLQDEIWEKGSKYIAKTSGVDALVKVLEAGNVKAQGKALWILERIFRIEDHKVKCGQSAQMVLIDLAQNGDPQLKPMVAKLLARLELLQDQSSYF